MRVFLVLALRNRFLTKLRFMRCSGEGIYIYLKQTPLSLVDTHWIYNRGISLVSQQSNKLLLACSRPSIHIQTAQWSCWCY